jgi:5-methylcytosine-specific restriction protein A
MTVSQVTSPEAVRAAAREFDALGEDAFLYEYGFGPASDSAVVIDGRLYPARALLGAAHGHQYPEIGPLTDGDFGGLSETAATLSELGFEVRGLGDGNEV